MEEIQSWWEIPAVAHFCYVFRAAFNLIYFDVAELEAAILDLQDPEMSISFEQLVIQLVQGCFKKGEVTSINLEEKLNELLEEYCDDENTLNITSLCVLTPRSKVQLLLKLCQIRLDIAVSMDAIKDIPAEVMQAKCIGQDSQNCSYWYFNDERLYKENLSKTGKQKAAEKSHKSINQVIKNKKRQSAREKRNECPKVDNSWSIACHNLNDWEKLAQKFSKSKVSSEKELAKEIKNTYLPIIQEAVTERERFLRKRYIELAPKRTSSRISKVQAQKRLEEQKAAEAEEKRRKEYEIELAKKEAQKKQQEIEDRRKRAEERRKIIEDRARRAQQRGMIRNFIGDYDDSNSGDQFKRNLRTTNSSYLRTNQMNTNDDDSDNNESESENIEVNSNRSEQSSEEDSNKEQSSSDEESVNEAESSDHSEDVETPTNNIGKRKYEQDVIHTYDLTQWRSTINTNGQRLHILQNTTSDITERKHFKLNESSNYKVSPLNGCNSTPRKEVHNLQTPFQMRNGNTYNAAARQAIVRIDFIKPPNNHISS